ncbi:MAG: hypothetical protein JWO80_3002, partial [Bryobacterales bacterium]|nr:hypothetical protein [Bryobacterales bacterium]
VQQVARITSAFPPAPTAPTPPHAAGSRFSSQQKEQPPVAVQTQDAQSPTLPLLLNVQPQIPDTDSTRGPEPQTAPTSPPPRRAAMPASAPQEPAAALSGSPWKQTTEKLPDAELAFAARVLTPDVKGNQQTAESAPMETSTSLPTPKPQIPATPTANPPDNPPHPDRQDSSAPSSKPDQPASPRKPSAAESSSPETRPEPPARTPTAPAELAPVSSPPAAFQPANQTVKPQHVSQTAEAHPLPEQPASPPGSPIRDFSLRLSANNQDKVEVKVVETAGEIRVAVRSADPELTTSLQQGIGDLVGKLEDRGLRTEMWKPPVEAATAASPTHSEAGANNQQQSSGDGSQGRQWREQQILPPRRRDKPDWLREIDGTFDTLHSDITRRTA